MLNKTRNKISGKKMFFNDNESIGVRCWADLERIDDPWYMWVYFSGELVYKLIAARVNELKASADVAVDEGELSRNYALSVAGNDNLKNTYFSHCMLHEIIQQIAFDKTNFTYNGQDVVMMSSSTSWCQKEYVAVEAIYNSRNIDEYDQKHPLEMTDFEIELMFMKMTKQMHDAIDNLMPLIVSGDLLVNADDKTKNDDSGDSAQ